MPPKEGVPVTEAELQAASAWVEAHAEELGVEERKADVREQGNERLVEQELNRLREAGVQTTAKQERDIWTALQDAWEVDHPSDEPDYSEAYDD